MSPSTADRRSPLGLFPGQTGAEALRPRAKVLCTRHYSRRTEATHLLEDGYDIRTVQELLGHKDVQTTMVYTQRIESRRSRGPQTARPSANAPSTESDGIIRNERAA